MYDYKKLGLLCKEFRCKKLKKTQSEVAEELQLTISSISMFENGNSRSADILLYYLINGFPANLLHDIIGG
jgi:transcriptional regulator with XRE-family HTH domain